MLSLTGVWGVSLRHVTTHCSSCVSYPQTFGLRQAQYATHAPRTRNSLVRATSRAPATDAQTREPRNGRPVSVRASSQLGGLAKRRKKLFSFQVGRTSRFATRSTSAAKAR